MFFGDFSITLSPALVIAFFIVITQLSKSMQSHFKPSISSLLSPVYAAIWTAISRAGFVDIISNKVANSSAV